MLFNSLGFLLFFPLVYSIYWFLLKEDYKKQNLFLLVSSYFFYSCWDWRFLFLLLFSTGLDYFSGIKMENTQHALHKKVWLWVSIGINLGFLGIFKYYNFFAESFQVGLKSIGISASPFFLDIVLPVGISFYTFHGLSYVIDVYYGRIRAERNIVDYSLFVSFFPLLVAGPIERATHLLPQIKTRRFFSY
jgi:D-alanyl-lipoteichoic acid acyltransferase DltB (MBOAT superfamily)